MKLRRKDVASRAEIKLNKSMHSEGGVMMFGKDNDYSNVIELIIAGSVTATSVADIHSRFIVGNGFEDKTINDIVVSADSRGKEITMLDLLRQCSDSVAVNHGLYIHNRVNVLGQTRDQQLFQFKTCKFSAVDDVNYTNSIIVNPDFGEKIYKKKNNAEYPVYNDNLDVIRSQFLDYSKNKKGFDSLEDLQGFPGQIYFHFWDNRYLYPLSPFDPVYLDADTEQEVALYKNRELRNGFMLRHIITVNEFSDDSDKEEFVKMVEGAEGADGSRVIVLEAEFDEETGDIKKGAAVKIDKIDTNVNDKLFENWENGISNKIRKATKVPAILIDYEEGKLSNTSGEAIIQASAYYNAMTRGDRAQMSRVFKEVFKNHIDEKLSGVKNWKIEPLSFEVAVEESLQDDNVNENLKNEVIRLQESVSLGKNTKASAIAMLELIHKVPKDQAVMLIGDPKGGNHVS
jgi:hypothetical protein